MRWQGEFAFGEAWLAFRGASADNRRHAHAALQLVAARAPITVVDDSGREHVGPGWAIRAGASHVLQPAPALTLVLADPQSRLAAQLQQALVRAPIAPLPPDLLALLTADGPLRDLPARVEQQLPGPRHPLDPRLAAALRLATQPGTGGEAAAVAAMAAHCGLSPSRLRALSQAQFGLPFAKLLLWSKVRRACVALAHGAGLAEAAQDAGFADQAHLTRTMARVIGLTPGEAKSASR